MIMTVSSLNQSEKKQSGHRIQGQSRNRVPVVIAVFAFGEQITGQQQSESSLSPSREPMTRIGRRLLSPLFDQVPFGYEYFWNSGGHYK